MGPLYFEILKRELAFLGQCKLLLAFLELRQGNGLNHVEEFVLAT